MFDDPQAAHVTYYYVSNEVRLGVIPMKEISHKFVDQTGWLDQVLATRVDKVTFIVAGLPMTLKDTSK